MAPARGRHDAARGGESPARKRPGQKKSRPTQTGAIPSGASLGSVEGVSGEEQATLAGPPPPDEEVTGADPSRAWPPGEPVAPTPAAESFWLFGGTPKKGRRVDR